MVAFERAVGVGYDHLELDVRTTSDGRVAVFHDATLDRVTGHTGPICERRWAELGEVRVDDVAPIPLLAEVLDAWPDVRVNIDPKDDLVTDPLVARLRAGGPALLERICVMAFSDRRLTRIRRALGPGLCTALGPGAMTRLRLAASGLPTRSLTGDVAQVPPSLARRQPSTPT